MNSAAEVAVPPAGLGPTEAELDEVFRLKHGAPESYGWMPRAWRRFHYFNPDDVYETLVAKLVTAGCAWMDVGCGRGVFPNNRPLARLLADRCGVLVGVDPDPNLDENPFVHRRVRGTIDRMAWDHPFDVVTLRMVAEHITEPESAVAALARLTRPGGRVVVYTVNRWSPAAIAARVVPFGLHHGIKRFLWGTEERDTFPVAYRMNTRRRLARLFGARGFREVHFAYLDDCRSFGHFRRLHHLELRLWTLLKAVGLRYPETCLLGVYQRQDGGIAAGPPGGPDGGGP
jgi:SAM-dependent methyltransferase